MSKRVPGKYSTDIWRKYTTSNTVLFQRYFSTNSIEKTVTQHIGKKTSQGQLSNDITNWCLVIQKGLILCDPMDCSLLGSSVHGDSPGKNTGVGCHALLQGIFPTQGLNPSLPYCRQILYHMSKQQNWSS